MPALDLGKAPANYVVLPFYGTGAIAFVLLTTLLFLSAFPLLGGFFNPHILAIVHTAALGFGTMTIFGASYQLLPVITEQDLNNEPLAHVSYYFLLGGAVCLIYSFWNLGLEVGTLLITGGSLVFVGAALYFYNVARTVIASGRYTAQKLFLLSSGFWLLTTITIGLLLAINLVHPYIYSRNHLEILKLHAHAGLAGWFLQLIIGVSIKLVPMFLLGHGKKDKWLNWSFILQNTGLVLFLLDGFFFGPSWRYILYVVMVAGGVALWLAFLIYIKKHRIKKPLDYSMYHTLMAFISLAIAFLLIPVIYFIGDQWAIVYGAFVFIGWIGNLILGMTFKTLPFIIWNNKYKGINGIAKIPLPKELFWGKLVKIQFWVYISALYIIALSLIFGAELPLRVGLGLMVITSIVYLVNTYKVLTHRRAKVIEQKEFKTVNG